MRLLCPEPQNFSDRAREVAAAHMEADFEPLNQAQFDRLAPEYDAVMVRFSTRVGGHVMGRRSRLKAVLSPTTGVDHIDVKAARGRRVKLFHLGDQSKFLRGVNATAKLTVALSLALMRKLPQAARAVLDGRWDVAPFRGHEVAGKTLGIVGYGRLGSKVARTARAMEMDVLAYDVRPRRLAARGTRGGLP